MGRLIKKLVSHHKKAKQQKNTVALLCVWMNGCCPQKESLKVEISAESAIISQFSMGKRNQDWQTVHLSKKRRRRREGGKIKKRELIIRSKNW